ncbi:hypothetical protein PLESTB_000801100 [Pleodorina starrii]|uniref:Uncharacterized protein n=1 Tax=Pleodorina starrii TaxID=330485 RepID=A0A9W6F2J0_9CHLO|nr:hypothetical protein PLESTB_000801100 [Pleodorina starrii]GLC75420.1 hypothetical protein PLESTF_001634900 [Pleodorina starrii]
MTQCCDAAAEGLWHPRAPVISGCRNVQSPSSSLSSQPCSPGPTGGLCGHTEKSLIEQAAMPLSAQDSFLRTKRIRLHVEKGARVGMQAYGHIEGAATSSQLACSVTPSPHSSESGLLLAASGGLAKFCAQLSTVYVGGSGPSGSADYAAKRARDGSIPDAFTNSLVKLMPSNVLLGNGTATASVEQPASSMPDWQPMQPHQPLQRYQQRIAQYVSSEQPASACSTTSIGSLALTLAICDMHASNQLAATGLPPPAVCNLHACAATEGGGCGPAVGGFQLPFVFTGSLPPVLATAPVGPALLAPLPAPPPPPPVVQSLHPLPCSLPATVFLDNGMLVNTGPARASSVHVACLPGAFDTLNAAASATAAAAAAAIDQLPAAAVQLRPPQLHPLPPLPLPPLPAAAVSQLQTPRLSYLSEPMRCAAPGGDPVGVIQPQQRNLGPPPLLKARHSQPRRVRPPSPPLAPPTPPQPGSLGAEDWILHVVKVLGMSEPDTARLALHCWRRVSELPQLHHAARLWPSTVVGRNLYATACLWVSIKLEEKRRAAPGGVVLAHLAATTPAALCSAELAVMNWLEWRPYDGYRLDESHLLVYM